MSVETNGGYCYCSVCGSEMGPDTPGWENDALFAEWVCVHTNFCGNQPTIEQLKLFEERND